MTAAASARDGRGTARSRRRGCAAAYGCRTGAVFCGELEPVRHRALHLGLLHAESDGLVELTPGTRPPGGKVEIDRRTRREHFLPGGATGTRRMARPPAGARPADRRRRLHPRRGSTASRARRRSSA